MHHLISGSSCVTAETGRGQGRRVPTTDAKVKSFCSGSHTADPSAGDSPESSALPRGDSRLQSCLETGRKHCVFGTSCHPYRIPALLISYIHTLESSASSTKSGAVTRRLEEGLSSLSWHRKGGSLPAAHRSPRRLRVPHQCRGCDPVDWLCDLEQTTHPFSLTSCHYLLKGGNKSSTM